MGEARLKFQHRATRRAKIVFGLKTTVLILMMAVTAILSAMMWSPRFEYGRQWSSSQSHNAIMFSLIGTLFAYLYTLLTITDKTPFTIACNQRMRNLAPTTLITILLLLTALIPTILTGWPSGVFIDWLRWGKDSQKAWHLWTAIANTLQMLCAIAYCYITGSIFFGIKEARIRSRDDEESFLRSGGRGSPYSSTGGYESDSSSGNEGYEAKDVLLGENKRRM